MLYAPGRFIFVDGVGITDAISITDNDGIMARGTNTVRTLADQLTN